MGLQPFTFVGSVVQNNITDAKYLPITAHLISDRFHIGYVSCLAIIVEFGVQTELITQTVS